MGDHYSIDVDPQPLRHVQRAYSTLSNHLHTKGGQARQTPGDIGDDWTGWAATSVKGEMTALGGLMRTSSVDFDSAATAAKELAEAYDEALTDVATLNTRYRSAVEEYDAEVKRIDGRQERAIDDVTKDGHVNEAIINDIESGYQSQKSGAAETKQKTIDKLDGDYDDIVRRLRRKTRATSRALNDATQVKVSTEIVAVWHQTGGHPSQPPLVPSAGAAEHLAAQLTLVDLRRSQLAPVEQDDPTIIPIGDNADSDGYRAGSLELTYRRAQSGPLEATGTVKLGAEDPTIDEDGREWQKVSLETAFELSGEAEKSLGKRLEAQIRAFTGERLRYSMIVPPSEVDEIVTEGRAPNPFSPLQMRPGEGVELTSEYYAGYEGGLTAYKLLHAGTSYEVSADLTTGIQRLPDDKVRVYVGPGEAVTEALSLGVGTDELSIGLKLEQTIRDYRLEQVDFDLKTEAGREAYREFLLFGTIPDDVGPGIENRLHLSGSEFSKRTAIEAKIGDLKASLGLGGSDSEFTWAEYPDGSIKYGWSYTEGDVQVTGFQLVAPDGYTVTDEEYQLRLRNVDPETATRFNESYAKSDYTVDSESNVVMSFSPDDMERFRREAAEQLAAGLRRDGDVEFWVEQFGHEPTGQDVIDWVNEYDGADETTMRELVRTQGTTGAWHLLTASNDFQILMPGVFDSYYGHHSFTAESLLGGMSDWKANTERTRGTGENVPGPGNTVARGSS